MYALWNSSTSSSERSPFVFTSGGRYRVSVIPPPPEGRGFLTHRVNIRDKFACDAGLAFGHLWDEMNNNAFPEFTTGCLEGLTAAAKQKVMDEWRKWKGLAN